MSREGKRWTDLSPVIKKKYEEKAAEDKARFNAEMELFKKGLFVPKSNGTEVGDCGDTETGEADNNNEEDVKKAFDAPEETERPEAQEA